MCTCKMRLEPHHGVMTWVNTTTDPLRNDLSMCMNCKRLKPGDMNNCNIAQKYYELCKEGGNAFIMTRCKHWIPFDSI